MIHKVDIKNLTIVINLIKTSASSYLNFMDDTKIIKQVDKAKIISSSRIENHYLIIYIDSKPTEIILTKMIIESLINNKIDFIAIDELFPNDKITLINNIDCPYKKNWVTKRIFNAKTSQINVKI